jgi:hypothetical protein
MSVRERIEDAKMLWEAGRKEGAFVMILIAVAKPPKKGRLSSHQAAVPWASCGSRRFTSQLYFSMYAWTTGFSPAGRSSSTGGSSVPTNCAKKRRSERSW